MNNTDQEYFRLLQLVLARGRVKKNRTGVDTIGTFGAQARFDLSEGFPLLTTKKVFMKGIIHELLWFIKGDTNIKYLVDNNVNIWNEWAYKRYLEKHNEKFLREVNGVKVLDVCPMDLNLFISHIKSSPEFAKEHGDLGEGTYGGMWREFPVYKYSPIGPEIPYGPEQTVLSSVDQLKKVVDKLKTNPDDRRLIVSAWHPYWVDHCALPPCHCLFQFHTEELTVEERVSYAVKNEILVKDDFKQLGVEYSTHPLVVKRMDELKVPTRRLNCQLYQRSCDLFLGVPFNIASYSLLLAMMAQVSNMVAGEFVHTYGDLHIYTNHLEQVKEQLSRNPRQLPQLKLNPEVKDLFAFKYEDITVEGYDPHPAIKGEVAV